MTPIPRTDGAEGIMSPHYFGREEEQKAQKRGEPRINANRRECGGREANSSAERSGPHSLDHETQKLS